MRHHTNSSYANCALVQMRMVLLELDQMASGDDAHRLSHVDDKGILRTQSVEQKRDLLQVCIFVEHERTLVNQRHNVLIPHRHFLPSCYFAGFDEHLCRQHSVTSPLDFGYYRILSDIFR
uniref:Uncharacterized protein n=1 Tax=Lotharella globosa TaxID=91324 RepID=A0A7S3YZP1_9EUKA